jgi:hypothetical protein
VAAEFAKSLSSIDGKLLRSFRSVLSAPGVRTAAHVRGQRRSFVGPLTLFFVANAVFVVVQGLVDAHILSSPLASHLHIQDWSSPAQELVSQRLQQQGRTLQEYTPVFNEAVAFNAKAFIILMVLAFAPVPITLFRDRQRTVGAHLVFSLHLYVFVLALLCVSVLLAEVQRQLGGRGLGSSTVDLVLSVSNLLACGLYIYLALGPAYGATGFTRIIKTCLLTLAVGGLFVAYRFVIFIITLYTT